MSAEYDQVELPFIQQLRAMGWDYLQEADEDKTAIPAFTERESFKDVLLKDRLRAAIASINRDENGQPWLDDARLSQAISRLEKLAQHTLIESNKAATELLIKGTVVEGPDGKNVTIRAEVQRVDFWRNRVAQEELRGKIAIYLDDEDLVPYDQVHKLADQIIQTAKANHILLTT